VLAKFRRRSALWKRKLWGRTHKPTIVQSQGTLALGSSPITFVVIVGPEFNQTVPNAATTARLGICHGFEQIGIPYLLLSVFDLERRLPDIPNSICWLSGSDYTYLDRANLMALKKRPHLVWVSTWFENDADFYRRHSFPNMSWPRALTGKILSTEPAIVFTISPERSFQFYEGWIRSGARLVSLPLACDTTLYRQRPALLSKFEMVKMAFVGGYWPYKALQFDRYLRPYEDQLSVFGYSPWPYANFGGRIAEAEEPYLYRQAKVSPVINEPHVEIMGTDVNERVFKVLGSGGCAVTDNTAVYREWFTEDELLVPHDLNEYHALIQQALGDEDFNRRFREKGYQAVVQRHTYAHRAKQIIDLLGMKSVITYKSSSV
jgi:hypothetical protein